jgi:hypothetical protein
MTATGRWGRSALALGLALVLVVSCDGPPASDGFTAEPMHVRGAPRADAGPPAPRFEPETAAELALDPEAPLFLELLQPPAEGR